ANHRLRKDRCRCRSGMHPQIIRAQQQCEAEPGDNRTSIRTWRIGAHAEGEMLRRDRRGEGENYLRSGEAEIAQPRACCEQDSEEQNLEDPRIAERGRELPVIET